MADFVEDTLELSSQPEKSTLHPDGWVGDPTELERARRYRKAIYWGSVPTWAAIVAIWFVDPPLLFLLFGIVFADLAIQLLLQSRISRIIGRKWTPWLESKEKSQKARQVAQARRSARDWRPRSRSEVPQGEGFNWDVEAEEEVHEPD